MKEGKKSFKIAFLKAGKSLWNSVPMILGTILLTGLTALIPKSFYVKIFGQNALLNSIIGATVGSISAGSPITSYILGGELLKQGVGWVTVTAFLVAWVTVGIIQLPAESALLGKKFAFLRNITAFILAIITAIATVAILGVTQ